MKNFFQGKVLFFENFDFNYKFKNEITDNNEKMKSTQRYSFQQNQFYGLLSSQRPPASVGLNTLIRKSEPKIF